MNRYYITYNLISSYFLNGRINLWINKNPGQYDTDPNYVPLEPQRLITILFDLMAKMPKAKFEVRE